MPIGEIVKTLPDRGFGFILPDDASDDAEHLFFHISKVVGHEMPDVGERVRYAVIQGRDGRTKAIDVTPLDHPTGSWRDDI